MLLSFTCANYRSYRAPATLDMQQRSFTRYRPKAGDWAAATQRIAALYGPNASGKSNLLRAFDTLQSAVLFSISDDKHVKQLRNPHRLGSNDKTSFTADFVAENIRFEWSLTLDNDGIQEELLRANETGRWRMVFHRERDEVTFGPQSGIPKAAQQNLDEYATPWALTLSAWQRVKSTGPYYPAVRWWTHMLDYLNTHVSRHAGVLKLANNHPSWLNLGIAALATANVGISKIKIKEEVAPERIKRAITAINAALSNEFEDTEFGSLSESDLDYIREHLEFTHTSSDGDFSLGESDESQGTMAWFDLLIPAVLRFVVGGVFIVDEIDSSLHPLLLRELVELFKDPETNPGAAQIIFTTHDVTLLGNDLETVITPAEAWLVEKFDSYSQLIAWDEYAIRKNHNLEKRYLQGAFGALPVTDRSRVRDAITALRNEYLDLSEE